MRKRAISLVEVIVSMTLVAGCFAFTYQLLGYAQKKRKRQERKIEKSLEHAALASAFVETVGQAEVMLNQDLLKLFNEPQGIGFMYKNFADPNPKLCGDVYAAIALDSKKPNLELRLFAIDENRKNYTSADKTVVLYRNVDSWSIEELNLNRSLHWQPVKELMIKKPTQALRISVVSKGEEFCFVVNFLNDTALPLNPAKSNQAQGDKDVR